MERKNTFIFNLEWDEILSELPKEVKYEVYDAIIEYAKSGKLTDLKPIAKGVFLFIRRELDYNDSTYALKCQRNRENGSKGGRPAKTEKTERFDEKPKKANGFFENPNNDNDNDIKKNSEKRNPDGAEVLEAYFDESRRGSLESLAMSLHVGMDELRAIAEECVNDWTLGGETHTDMSEAQKHLTNHIRRKAEAWRQNPAKKTAPPAIPRERWAARIERRSETEWVVHQYGGVEPIPVGTPDPPGPTHVWYNGRWVYQ